MDVAAALEFVRSHHNAVLATRRRNATPQRLQAYLEEGRLLLLELMGDLVSRYRRHAPDGVTARPPDGATEEAPHG